MSFDRQSFEEEVLKLYYEPIIGANYTNTYGEENLVNLVKKYRSLPPEKMDVMREMVINFSQSQDLGSSFVSVGVLHALGMSDEVTAAYDWAQTQEDCQMITSHFDIGKSLADHFIAS